MKKVFYHLGLCVGLVCALLGSLQTQSLRIQLREGIPERKAVDGKGIVHDLEETYLLHHYNQETYDSGKPKSYRSDLSVFTAAGQEIRGTVAVNHPMKVGLWRIYQYDPGVLLLVKNPFLPGVYLGIYLMLAAALLLLFDKGLGRNPWLLAAVLLAVGTGIYLFHGRLLSRELVPALQSMWYAPHVVVYMVAFTILTASALLSLYLLVFPRGTGDQDLFRNGFLYGGHAAGLPLGAGCLGNLLGMGSEGDLGGHYLAGLSGLYPFAPFPSGVAEGNLPASAPGLYLPAYLLVGNQLSAFFPGNQPAYILIFTGISCKYSGCFLN